MCSKSSKKCVCPTPSIDLCHYPLLARLATLYRDESMRFCAVQYHVRVCVNAFRSDSGFPHPSSSHPPSFAGRACHAGQGREQGGGRKQ